MLVVVAFTFIIKLRYYYYYFGFVKTWYHYVVKANLHLMILLLHPSECWDYRCGPPHQAQNQILLLLFECFPM
jgi:hypothetical protein